MAATPLPLPACRCFPSLLLFRCLPGPMSHAHRAVLLPALHAASATGQLACLLAVLALPLPSCRCPAAAPRMVGRRTVQLSRSVVNDFALPCPALPSCRHHHLQHVHPEAAPRPLRAAVPQVWVCGGGGVGGSWCDFMCETTVSWVLQDIAHKGSRQRRQRVGRGCSGGAAGVRALLAAPLAVLPRQRCALACDGQNRAAAGAPIAQRAPVWG